MDKIASHTRMSSSLRSLSFWASNSRARTRELEFEILGRVGPEALEFEYLVFREASDSRRGLGGLGPKMLLGFSLGWQLLGSREVDPWPNKGFEIWEPA
jgi:hypothetical protein